MTPLRLIFLSCSLALTAACATTVRPVEIPGLENFATPCTGEPAVLSDEEARALADTMPSAEQRERDFWSPNALSFRAVLACERARANGAVNAGRRFNQEVRNSAP